MSYINMNAVFASLDARKAEAEKVIAKFNADQVAEASRVASLYHAKGSIKHAEAVAKELTANQSINNCKGNQL